MTASRGAVVVSAELRADPDDPDGVKENMVAELTPEEARLAAEYVVDLDWRRAGERAGLAVSVVKKLRVKQAVLDEVARIEHLRHDATLVTAERVLLELAAVGFGSVGQFFDFAPDGNGGTKVTLNLHEATPEQIATIGEIKVTEAVDGSQTVHFKMHDKLAALKMLGQHHKLFNRALEESDVGARAERMVRARQRLGERVVDAEVVEPR